MKAGGGWLNWARERPGLCLKPDREGSRSRTQEARSWDPVQGGEGDPGRGSEVTGERLPRLRSGPRGVSGPWRITPPPGALQPPCGEKAAATRPLCAAVTATLLGPGSPGGRACGASSVLPPGASSPLRSLFPTLPAAAAKSLQSCPTLCDPINGGPPGSSVHWILQARTLERDAISFSNACLHAKSLQPCPTLCDPKDTLPFSLDSEKSEQTHAPLFKC